MILGSHPNWPAWIVTAAKSKVVHLHPMLTINTDDPHPGLNLKDAVEGSVHDWLTAMDVCWYA